MKKAIYHSNLFSFVVVTLAFITSRFVLFRGFNGTDDLHYAMLSARLLKGIYNPFQPDDIFSGRIILVAWQALLYKTGGINVLMTSAGTVAALVLSCLLTVTRLLPVRTPATMLVAGCLFYFNPAIANDITGISPDPYILLIGTWILVLLKNGMEQDASRKKAAGHAVLIGALIAISLLIKETIIVFLPYAMLMTLLYHRQRLNSLWIFAGCMLVILLIGGGYALFTGNAFFKITQIQNSAYPNPCNFSSLPAKDLLIRLSYGVWRAFIILGFYPFVLGGIALVATLLHKKKFSLKDEYNLTGFILLLLLSLYFPFSWKGYQPLCAVPRHFYFLLPPAVTMIVTALYNQPKQRTDLLFALLSLVVLVVCIQSSHNKWQWMVYSMLSIYCTARPLLQKLAGNFHYLIFSGILFISPYEPLFFNRTHWFTNLQQLHHSLHANHYYFPDHDNMMHWKLFDHFDGRSIHSYNIEKHPYKVYQVYYENPDSTRFHPGWLVVNKVYTTCSPVFLNKVDSLQQTGYFSNHIIANDVEAYWLDKKAQVDYIRAINFRK